MWIPTALAEAHYTACNGLGYAPREFAEMGKDVGDRIHGTMLSTAVRLAKGAGVTPWTIYAQFGRFWERIFIGGGIAVQKLGPKEAHVEVVGQPLVGIHYYRAAQKALFLGLIELLARRRTPSTSQAPGPPPASCTDSPGSDPVLRSAPCVLASSPSTSCARYLVAARSSTKRWRSCGAGPSSRSPRRRSTASARERSTPRPSAGSTRRRGAPAPTR